MGEVGRWGEFVRETCRDVSLEVFREAIVCGTLTGGISRPCLDEDRVGTGDEDLETGLLWIAANKLRILWSSSDIKRYQARMI
jgi:hypothetical protein